MSAPTWPEEVGRELLALGVPWLPGVLSHGGMRVGNKIRGVDGIEWRIAQPHSADWPDLRDGGSIGAVWLWLEQRAGYTVGVHPGLTHHGRHYCYVGDLDADDVPRGEGDTPEEARARGFLALAREVLS